jgi:hypothetical protein
LIGTFQNQGLPNTVKHLEAIHLHRGNW